MIDGKILKALQTAIIAAVTASSAPTLPVKYVGITAVPPNDGKYLEVIFIPNNNENEFWDDGKTYRGILRLLLHWQITEAGTYGATDLAASIAGYFTKGRRFTMTGETVELQILDKPNLLGVMEAPPELLLPISIRYQCFKA